MAIDNKKKVDVIMRFGPIKDKGICTGQDLDVLLPVRRGEKPVRMM